MTSTTQPVDTTVGTSGDTDGRLVTAGGGIERVNAFDGLFLRAEHLNRMQDYSLALATAVGMAGGSGVAYGFELTLEGGDSVQVAPGLAISPGGRPLRSDRVAASSLADLAPSGDRFWWVEIGAAQWTFGEEAVQGMLCDEPCGSGTTQRVSRAEGAVVRLVEDTRLGLGGVPDDHKLSWLAARLFEAERGAAMGWPGQPGLQLAGLSWSPPAAPAGRADGVRLGVLVPGDSTGWQLDMWVARRDRGDPPPARHWQWRLGMRPWDVFVAHVLQFQAQLEARIESAPGLRGLGYVAELLGRLDVVRASLDPERRMTKRESAATLNRLEKDIRDGLLGRAPRVGTGAETLPSVGIDELPSAGLLAVTASGDDIGPEVTRLLGGEISVRLRVCRGALGDVGAFLAAAQHRARIPLGTGQQPVDILVPKGDGSTELDWVAFRRAEELDCGIQDGPVETPVEPVAVFFLEEAGDEAELYERYIAYLTDPEGDPPDRPEGPGVELHYPVRTWALPADADYAGVLEEVHGLDVDLVVVAVVSGEERRALGAVRAGLLAERFDRKRGNSVDVRTIARPGAEAIVVLVAQTPVG